MLTPTATSINVVFSIGSTGADLLTDLPTFTTPVSPACVIPTYSVVTTVSGAGGNAAVATVSLSPDATNPTAVSFEVTDST